MMTEDFHNSDQSTALILLAEDKCYEDMYYIILIYKKT